VQQSAARKSEIVLILLGIGNILQRLLEWLKAFGALGLFGISLVDSMGIPLPGGPDAVMIWLSVSNPSLMLVYALAATCGSAIGCTVLYLIARRAGVAGLKRVSQKRRDRIENLLGRYDLVAVMVPAILPPPFPFKPFVLCAGVFKLKTVRFISAVFVGRAIRFAIEGWLAIRFGDGASRIITQHGWKVLVLVAVSALIYSAFIWWRVRVRSSNQESIEESRPAQ